MQSSRPYLIRALYQWILDNHCTPHILVNTNYPGVIVPPGFAEDGKVVLNISPSAARNLLIDQKTIGFESRFGGVAHNLCIPNTAVLGIYARENNQGMFFEDPKDLAEKANPTPPPDNSPPTSPKRPKLTLVK